MKKIITIAQLNIKLWFQSPNAIVSAILPTVAMTFLLAILSISVTTQPVALIVQGQGPYSAKMEEIIRSDEDAYWLTTTKDWATAQKMLDNQEVSAVIVIPSSFDHDLKYTGRANVQLILNNIDIDFADDIRRSVDRSVAGFDAPLLGCAGECADVSSEVDLSNPPNPYLINIDERDLRQTTVDFLHYQLIPAFILLILSTGMVGVALLCAIDVEKKISRYVVITPASARELILGRLLGGFLITAAVVIPAYVLAYVGGIIPIPAISHIPSLILLFLVTIICACGLGAVIGTIVKGSHNISLVCVILATVLFFLGGGFTTIAFLPNWIQIISSLNPMRYAIDGLRQILFYPNLTNVGFDILIVMIISLVAIIVGTFFMRRSLAR